LARSTIQTRRSAVSSTFTASPTSSGDFELGLTLLVRFLIGLAIITHVSRNGDQPAPLRTPDALAQSRPPSDLDDKVDLPSSGQFRDLDIPIRVSGIIDRLNRVFTTGRSEERLEGSSRGVEL